MSINLDEIFSQMAEYDDLKVVMRSPKSGLLNRLAVIVGSIIIDVGHAIHDHGCYINEIDNLVSRS